MAERESLDLTTKQRNSILDRDDHQPQMRHYDEERGWHKGGLCGTDNCGHLHVHHIVAIRTAEGLGWSRDETNRPENLITLAQCEHNGVCPSKRI